MKHQEDYVIVLEDRRKIESRQRPGDFFVLGYDEQGRLQPLKPNELKNRRLMTFEKDSPLTSLFKASIRSLLGSNLFRMFQVPKNSIMESISKLGELIRSGKNPTEQSDFAIKDSPEYSIIKESAPEFNESDIKSETLQSLGIDAEEFRKSENYRKLLDGERTSLLTVKIPFGGSEIEQDVKLRLTYDDSGKACLGIITKMKEPRLEEPYKGISLTEEDKENLLVTGNLGRMVNLKNNKGELYPAYVSLDRETNRLVSVDARGFDFPKEIGGVKLSQAQYWALREGEQVELRGISDEEGRKRVVTLQFNACDGIIDARYGGKTRMNISQNNSRKETRKEEKKESRKIPPVIRNLKTREPKRKYRGSKL